MNEHWAIMLAVVLLAVAVPAQEFGSWEVLYAAPGELLVANAAAQFRGRAERPMIYVHCKDGTPRVFMKPAPRILRLQFDGGKQFQGRFVEQTFGFETDDEGKLVERTIDTNVPPLKGLNDPGQLIESMQQHERLYLRAGPGAERNHFELAGLSELLERVNDPCSRKDAGRGR